MSIKYHGKRGIVYVSASGSVAAGPAAGIRAFTLDGAQDDVDTTEFGEGNRTSVLGFPAFRGTIDGFWASDDTLLRQASTSTDGCHLYLYPSRDAPSKYVGGPAWLDFSIRSAVDAAVTLTGNFRAKGQWNNAL
jgi:hypothetical protein